MKLVRVTCSEVISQQAEDPFCEDAGSEKVVPVVIHRKFGFHLSGTRHTLNTMVKITDSKSNKMFGWV